MNYPFENDTSAVIKKLARKSVRFDKKKNLFCLSAIIVAVAMIMMSLLTVQNIIYQNQKEIEGLHQGIFFDITQDSKEKLLANEEVKSVGLSCNIKIVKENSKELSLIYYDDDMLSLIPAFDGKYPEKASEIAVTDAFFASENKSPEINAIVQLNLDGTLKNYTIVGIYHDKTSTAYPVFVNTGAALLDAVVLAVVSREEEGTYGYKITQDVREVLEVSESTLYPVLRRLKKDGCLEVYDKQYGGRNRRYYKITSVGIAQLSLYKEEWKQYSQRISGIFEGGERV